MDNKDRLKTLIEYIKIKNIITIQELAQHFSISEMTIRRDAAKLAKKNLIKVIHGAVIYNKNSINSNISLTDTYRLTNASNSYLKEKKLIAQEAVSLIEENDIIILDNGSTTECLAELLPYDKNITVICFALNILEKVHEVGIKNIIFPGGYYRNEAMSFESRTAVNFLLEHRASKAFISTSGATIRYGLTTSSYNGAEMKKSAIKISHKKILLSDSSKFGKIQVANFADLKDFDICITDKNIQNKYLEYFKSIEIELKII